MVDVNLEGIEIARAPRKSGIRYIGPVGFDNTVPSLVNSGSTSSAGLSTKAARADHTHGQTLASSAPPIVSGPTSSIGTSSTPARSDHTHGVDFATLAAAVDFSLHTASSAPPVVASGSTSVTGTSELLARADHTHGLALASSAPPVVAEGSSVLGSATTPARSDHTHGSSTKAVESGTLTSGNMSIAVLAHSPVDIRNTIVSVNGIVLRPTTEYTVVSNTILATSALNVLYGGTGSDGLGFSSSDAYVVSYNY